MKREQQSKQPSTNQFKKYFDEGIEEGKSYYISRFRVVENNGTGRCSNHKCRIFFEFSTSVFTVVNNTIPMQVFNFASFKNIIDDNSTPVLCVDILGEIISYHPICDPAKNVKVATMRGATKVYVNLDTPEVVELKKRRSVDHDAQSSRLSAVTNDSEDILSKAKIAILKEINCTEQKCNRHEDGLYYCSSARGCPNATNGVKSATPRFNVKFFVTGGDDVFPEFIMFDQQIGKVIDISASKLLERMEQEIVVKLRVSREFNLQSRRSYCYTVVKFSDNKSMISKWSESYSKSKITNDATELLGSPTTPCSFQTPSKRDFDDTDEVFEITPIPDKESIKKPMANKFKSRKNENGLLNFSWSLVVFCFILSFYLLCVIC